MLRFFAFSWDKLVSLLFTSCRWLILCNLRSRSLLLFFGHILFLSFFVRFFLSLSSFENSSGYFKNEKSGGKFERFWCLERQNELCGDVSQRLSLRSWFLENRLFCVLVWLFFFLFLVFSFPTVTRIAQLETNSWISSKNSKALFCRCELCTEAFWIERYFYFLMIPCAILHKLLPYMMGKAESKTYFLIESHESYEACLLDSSVYCIVFQDPSQLSFRHFEKNALIVRPPWRRW